MEKDAHSDKEIIEILNLKKVAVIGMSKHEEKAAHFVPKYLSENGFDIIPVNPNNDEILNTFNLIQSVVAKFKIDMTMAMGVGIDYISGDGD